LAGGLSEQKMYAPGPKILKEKNLSATATSVAKEKKEREGTFSVFRLLAKWGGDVAGEQ